MAKAKSTVKASKAKIGMNKEKIIDIVSDDMAGYGDVAARIFSVMCKDPRIAEEADHDAALDDAKLFEASVKKKMDFVNKITEGKSASQPIRALSKILLSETKVGKANAPSPLGPVLQIKPMPLEALRKLALGLVLAQTARSRFGYPRVSEKALSPKAREVQNFFDDGKGKGFGCQQKPIAKAVSAYLGEEIYAEDVDNDDRLDFENYKTFGLIDNDGTLMLVATPKDCDGDVCGFDGDGDRHFLEDGEHHESKPATDAECKSFIGKMKEKQLRNVFSFLEVR